MYITLTSIVSFYYSSWTVCLILFLFCSPSMGLYLHPYWSFSCDLLCFQLFGCWFFYFILVDPVTLTVSTASLRLSLTSVLIQGIGSVLNWEWRQESRWEITWPPPFLFSNIESNLWCPFSLIRLLSDSELGEFDLKQIVAPASDCSWP